MYIDGFCIIHTYMPREDHAVLHVNGSGVWRLDLVLPVVQVWNLCLPGIYMTDLFYHCNGYELSKQDRHVTVVKDRA